MNTHRPVILIWANINPNKHGSYEDFLSAIASSGHENDMRIVVATGDDVADDIAIQFQQAKVEHLPLPINELSDPRVLRHHLKALSPDLVHLSFASPCSPLIPTVRLHSKAKLILADHASTPMNEPAESWPQLRQLRRRAYGLAVHHFIAVSNFVAKRIEQNSSVPPSRISTFYNGIDLKRYSPPQRDAAWQAQRQSIFNASADDIVVIFIGQLTAEKGLQDFLQLAKSCRDRSQIKFAVVGAGELEGEVLKAVNDELRFLGRRNDVPRLLQLADVAICPSYWGEAFCRVLAEAAACETSSIATNIGGMPEVVDDGKSGLVIEIGDVAAMHKQLLDWTENRNVLLNTQKMARKRAEALFDINDLVANTLSLYKSVLGTR